MKKVKTFEAFMGSQIEEMTQEIDDMLVELRDKGFNTRVESNNTYRPLSQNKKKRLFRSSGGPWIQIYISRKNNGFGYADIEDVVERIKSYLAEAEEGLFYSGRNEEERSTGRPIISTSRTYNPMNFEVEGIHTTCSLTFKTREED